MVQALENLVAALSRLPTIGRKSAMRLALHLLERPQEEIDALAQSIASVKRSTKICRECFNYADTDLCAVCSSSSRDRSTICVVEKPADVISIEKSGRYHGLYHVLGGLLSPIDGITPERIRIRELRQRMEKEPVAELILGLGSSGEAETTSLYIARLFAGRHARITRLARGLPAGMELEYIDQLTLTQALTERTDMRFGEERS
jgi:recombination protein RecR